jgi:hypothetical protein
MSLEDFDHAVRVRAANVLPQMRAEERDKLLACTDRFYSCYSSGDFEAFKGFRLRPPFKVAERLVSAVRQIASQKGAPLTSDKDIVRYAWITFNGTNRIGEVSEKSLVLSLVRRPDLGRGLRQPNLASVRRPGLEASCWEGSVVYESGPSDLLSREGTLRFFTLQLSVRFWPYHDGPATPLVLIGYWDPTRADWMPYLLCTAFHVGAYDTIF